MQNEEGLAALAGVLLAGATVLLIVWAILILVCWLLYDGLKRVPAEHRKLEPGLVWLLLIPCFSFIWAFFVFTRIPDSFRSHFEASGRTDLGDCGKAVGLAFAISMAATIVPVLNWLAGPVSLILLIVFLVKVNDLKKQLAPAP